MLSVATETTTSTSDDSFAEFKEGIKLLKNDYPQKALLKQQSAFDSDKNNPYYISFLGVSIARAQQDWTQATELCDRAVQLNPKEIQFHLNLAEVYALAGLREMSLHKLDCALGLLGDDARLKWARSKIEKTPNSRVAILRARAFFEPGTWQAATSHIEALRIDGFQPSTPTIRITLRTPGTSARGRIYFLYDSIPRKSDEQSDRFA